jgi:hypothetical protein
VSKESRKQALLAKQKRILAQKERERVFSMSLPSTRDQLPSNNFPSGLLPNSDTRASAVVSIGSIVWKIFGCIEHVDFLLSFREEKLAAIFNFFQNYGWWMAAIGGAIWYLISKRKVENQPPIGFSLVVAASAISFMFGLLLAVQVTGSVPLLVTKWGDTKRGCEATIDTSRLTSFSAGYKLALICLFRDPTINPGADDSIAISTLWDITGMPVDVETSEIRNPEMWAASKGKIMWTLPVLIPNGIGIDKISTLNDVKNMGGKVLAQPYYW